VYSQVPKVETIKPANCKAHEAIHVGDSLASDIAGAHNSGITSVWIQHQQPLDAELGINPHHTLLNPSEIPALVRELSQMWVADRYALARQIERLQ